MMGELQFFHGLQIKQSKEGTIVRKYTKDIVWKIKMEDSKVVAEGPIRRPERGGVNGSR
jgi:hypothetical protein